MNRTKKLGIALALVALVALPLAVAGETVVVTVDAGFRSVLPAGADCGSFAFSWTLGSPSACSAVGGWAADGRWKIEDATFDGLGSHLVVTLPDLSNGGAPIPASAVRVDLDAITMQVLEGDGLNKPVKATTGITPQTNAGVTWMTAALAAGNGIYAFNPSWSIYLPAGQESGSYSATVSANYLSGP